MTNVLPMPERPLFYRLDEQRVARPISITSFLERSARSGEALTSLVKATYVLDNRAHRMLVSTVFLGVDHALDGEPVLFETMILGGALHGTTWRYSSNQEAESGHEKVVNLISGHCLQLLLPYKEAS
ncbi:hypothetical protein ACK36G_18560 [Aeromonas veronii]|uniref:hypothetical protein n=1 Tax=Aeromonas TaxID=642 RepID=UPI002E7BF88C|nr:hypothetical protein [Aeromonas caviae]MEE1913632.1 hypothetical protein [Aeromonas caviae]